MKNIKLYTLLGAFFFHSITSCFAMEDEFNNDFLNEKVPISSNPELEKKAIAAVNKYAQDKDTVPLARHIAIGKDSLGAIFIFDSETMTKGPLILCSYREWSNLRVNELQPYLSCLRWKDISTLFFEKHTPN